MAPVSERSMNTKESRLARQLMIESGLTYQQALLRVRGEFSREQPAPASPSGEPVNKGMYIVVGNHYEKNASPAIAPDRTVRIGPGEMGRFTADIHRPFKLTGLKLGCGGVPVSTRFGTQELILTAILVNGKDVLKELADKYVIPFAMKGVYHLECEAAAVGSQIIFEAFNPTAHLAEFGFWLSGYYIDESDLLPVPEKSRRLYFVTDILKPSGDRELLSKEPLICVARLQFSVKQPFQPKQIRIKDATFTTRKRNTLPVEHGCESAILMNVGIFEEGQNQSFEPTHHGIYATFFDDDIHTRDFEFDVMPAGSTLVLEFANPSDHEIGPLRISVEGDIEPPAVEKSRRVRSLK